MRFDYTITVDDVRESFRPATPDGRPAPKRGTAGRGLLGWVVFIVLALVLVYLLQTHNAHPAVGQPAPAASTPDEPPPQDLWVTLLPTVLPAAFLTVFLVASLRGQAVRARRVADAVAAGRPVPPASAGRLLALFTIMAPIALALALFSGDSSALAIEWRPTPTAALWAGFAPWIVAFVAIVAVMSWAGRSTAVLYWSSSAFFRRALSAEVDDVGVSTSDGLCDTLYRWPAVTRYRETDALLLLTLEDAKVLILPKRALPDAAAEDQLRGLIQTHVADGTFLPRSTAFAVVPLTS